MGSIAVLGAGNVGLVIAGHMAIRGHDVRLYDRWETSLTPFIEQGGIELYGEITGTGMPAIVTTDMSEAVKGAELIVIAAPAFAHDYLSGEVAKHATEDQIVIFQPGTIGSGVNLIRHFEALGRPASKIVETATSLYTCRKETLTRIYVGAVKFAVALASIPYTAQNECLVAINGYFMDRYVSGENALAVGLNNANPIYHVPPSVLNFKTVEDSDCHPLHSLVSPRIADCINSADLERIALGEAFGVEVASYWDFLESAYGATEGSYQERIIQGYGKQGFPEPDSIKHRYFTEDIPFGMVTWASLAQEAGVDMPLTNAFIALGSELCGQAFVGEGRTVKSLGLEGAGISGIKRAFIDGVLPESS